jgi:mannitol/fructose-specific phosphotransferase system IIA component (Ntr-type)
MSCLAELVVPSQVSLVLRGGDPAAVLGELVKLVPEVRDRAADREAFLHALLERERMQSTATGGGIALPHARSALAGLLQRRLLVFGRHDRGVNFGAPDAQPVHLFFLIATTCSTEHLGMLSRLSRVLRDGRLRGDLLAAKSPGEISTLVAAAEARVFKGG